MNAMTLAELIVIDPYFADCVLPPVHVGAFLNHLGKKCFAFSSLDKSNIPDILASGPGSDPNGGVGVVE